MAEAKKKESNLKTAKDVIFVYSSCTHAQKQLNKDNKPAMSDNPLEFHGYEIKILVTESYFKAMKKQFKGAKNFPNVKEFTPDECVEKFEIDEPDEDMVLIKFTQGCMYGPKGNRKESRPVGLLGIKRTKTNDGVAYFDNNGNVITKETSIGNGTTVHLQFNPVENAHGLYLYPTAVCVTNLVEYVAASSSCDEDAFGIEDVEGEAPEADAGEPSFDDDGGDQFEDPQF